MFKLKFSKPNYCNYTKNGMQVVKCVYQCEEYNSESGESINKFKAEGIAVCAKEDTYDERIGRIIADSRAKSFAYKQVRDHFSLRDVAEMKMKIAMLSELLSYRKKMQFLTNQENKHLNYVLASNK